MSHTVLLVDDEPNILAGLQRALRKEPYEILSASSVEGAFGILQSTEVDVVISDQDMPGMVGTVFLSKVHEQFPEVACYLLTGKNALAGHLETVKEGTISRFFTKPCNREELVSALQQTLQQKDPVMEATPPPPAGMLQVAEFERLARDYPGIMLELTDTLRQIMQRRGLVREVTRLEQAGTLQVAKFERLSREHPDIMRELTSALRQIIQRRGLAMEGTREPGLPTYQVVENQGSTRVSPRFTTPQRDQGNASTTGAEAITLETCLHEFRQAVASSKPGPAIIMQVRRDQGDTRILGPEDSSFEECLSRCAAVEEILLIDSQRGQTMKATLESMQRTDFVVETKTSTLFRKQGEKLLAVFPVLPQEYYIFLTWIDAIHIKRLKLQYQVPHYHVRRK